MTGGKEGRGHGKVQARFGVRRWGVLERGASRPPYRDAGTVARSAYARAPIEPCPAGSRPTWFGSMRQGVDNLAFGNDAGVAGVTPLRSEEHTSELQSLMRISYAVFCLKKKTYKECTRTTADTS